MAGIDELSIQINASAQGAINTIDSLIARLDNLSTSLSKLNASSLNSLADGVGQLSLSMQSFKQTSRASDFTSLAKNLDKLGAVNVAGINTVTSSIKGIADGMDLLSNTTFNGAGVAQFASIISKLGGAKSSKAYTTLPTMSAQLQNFVRQMNNIGSVTFNVESLRNLVSGISRLGATNAVQATTNLIPLSKALQTFVTNVNSTGAVTYDPTALLGVANAISRLGSKGVTNANTILPELSKNLNALIATLANSPQVSQNTIELVRALGQLSARGNAVASSTQRMSTGLNTFGHSARNARKHTMSLARAFGTFYANCFLLIRGIKALGNAITKAMDFAETYNYFQNSYNALATKVEGEWAQLGYDSADAYYESLKNNAQQLSQKMTGFIIADDGSSFERGYGASLGLDPTMLTNYQAQFAQLSSSMGVASETASDLSNALAMIGADIASVKNQDFSEVYNRLSSGLVGQSRAVDSFGINIRDSALQEKMLELGIEGTIKNLGQQDKALLRTITILDSSRYAWSDLSNTLDMPANQLRMLKANFSSLATTIGSVFLGAVQSVLPYINALVIALQRLMEYIIKFFGITIPTSSAKSNDAMSDLLDSIYATDDAMDSASGSAKKLKQNLLGIDELNVLNNDDSNSGSGVGAGATSTAQLQEAFNSLFNEYQNAWNDAFNNLNNQAQQMANNIVDAFKKGDFKAIGTVISEALRDALNAINWDTIFEFAKNWATNLANFLNGLIRPDTFYAIGKTIANALNTAFYFVGEFVRTFDWVNAGLSMASALQGFVDSIDVVEWARTIHDAFVGVIKMVNKFLANAPWKEIGEKIGEFISNLGWGEILKGVASIILNAIVSGFELLTGIFDANPIAGVIVTGIVSALSASKIIEIANAFKTIFTSSKILSVFTSAGATAGGSVATGMASAGSASAISSAGLGLGTKIGLGIMTAIAGLKIGEWIAVNVFGEDTANLLSNNWQTVLDYAFSTKDEIYEIEETRNVVEATCAELDKYNASLVNITTSIGLVDFETFTGGISKTSEAGREIVTQINDSLSAIGSLDIALNDTNAVMDFLTNSSYALDDATLEYLQTLSQQYDQLTMSEKIMLRNAYGIELMDSDLTKLGGNNGMPSYVSEIQMAKEEQEQLEKATSNSTTSTYNFNSAINHLNTNGMPESVKNLGYVQNALQGYVEKVDNINHNGMPSYVENMLNASKTTSDLTTDLGTLNTATESTTAYFETANSYVSNMTDSILNMSGSAIPTLQNKFDELGNTVESDWKDADSDTTTYTNSIYTTVSTTSAQMLEDLDVNLTTAKTNIATVLGEIQLNMSTVFSQMQTNVQTVFTNTITNVETQMNDAVTWFNENIAPKFSEQSFAEILKGIPPAFKTAFKNAFNGVVEIMNCMIDEINDAFDISWDAVEVNGKEIVSAGSARVLEMSHIQGFAQGGFPTSSDLFFANENGNAEYVGSFGNRTAVANNDQIVAGITNGVRSAVADVMLPYLVQISDNTRETANKDFSVNIGDRDIARANVRGQRSMGRTLISTT